jgi:acyl-CoA synthetase (NDP forming)
VGAFTAASWLTKKEDEAKATVSQALESESANTIHTNDLHHVQLSLDRIEAAQGETAKAMTDMKEAIVAGQNSSKDAIVQAILTEIIKLK